MKCYRAMILADLHLSNTLPHARSTGGERARGLTDRFFSQLVGLTEIAEIANREDVEDIFILGDFWDRALLDAVTLWWTLDALKVFLRPVWILGGNHDASGTAAKTFTVEAFKVFGLDSVNYLDEMQPVERNGIKFWPINYAPTEALMEKIKVLRGKINPRGKNVLLGHAPVVGCAMNMNQNSTEGLLADEAREGFDYTFLGHFHKHQYFGADKRGEYVGAPWHLGFQSVGIDPVCRVYEFHATKRGLSCHGESFALSAPKFWKVEGKIEIPSGAKPGDYIRSIVDRTSADWVSEREAFEAKAAKMCERGFRYTVKLNPIPQHTKRSRKISRKDLGRDYRKMISDYVESEDVDCGGLDPDRLKVLGRQYYKSGSAKRGRE